MTLTNKSKVKLWVGGVFTAVIAVVSLNYVIDPLWVFSHSNSLNNKQPVFNERQQKTNKLVFGLATQETQAYDSLMIGSSRGAMFDQNDFTGMKLFNYSANNMSPWEYSGWVEVAKKIKGSNFKNIVIAIDFFGTQSHLDKQANDPEQQPQRYLTRAQEPSYAYRSLLSLDTANNAFKGLMKAIRDPGVEYYDRNNVKFAMKVSAEKRDEYIQWNIEDHQKDFGDSYQYKVDWPDLLENLKAENPKTNFIILTTPVTKVWFDEFVNPKHLNDYKRWLKETVQVFGKVHHFMDMNSVTNNLDNFFDAHHVYKEITQIMAKKASNNVESTNLSDDFGIVLTPENIEAYLARF